MQDKFVLPDNETIWISQITKIGKIVNFNNSVHNLMGFTINLKNGKMKNVSYFFNPDNEMKIKEKLEKLHAELETNLDVK